MASQDRSLLRGALSEVTLILLSVFGKCQRCGDDHSRPGPHGSLNTWLDPCPVPVSPIVL